MPKRRRRCGAMHCSDEAQAAGIASGDYAFPILFAPELHRCEFTSAMADMKNSVKDRANAQSSCAGWFIQENLLHTGYEGVALHVDMACPATRGERASGYGVSLVTKLLAKI